MKNILTLPTALLLAPLAALHAAETSSEQKLHVKDGQPQSGSFEPSGETKRVLFDHPLKGRYFELEALTVHDGGDSASIADLTLLGADGTPISSEFWTIAGVSSETTATESAAAVNAIDGQISNCWSSGMNSKLPHRLVIDLGREEMLGGFVYVPRQGSAETPGRIKNYTARLGNSLEPYYPPPLLDGFNADPSIRVFGDTYYIYPTSDKPNWNTTDFSVWSSKNLVDWKNEGMILDITKDLKWANLQAWAPDCIEKNGKYFFYFSALMKIGVAVSDRPTGPFVDPLGKPLIEKGGKVTTNAIDPCIFTDDDGQSYFYFGSGRHAQVFKLGDDMTSLMGDPVDIPLKEFREGIVVFKRKGKYYFMWSIEDARSPDYRVGWGMADSPFGPVTSPTEGFIVLQKNGPAIGTAHHGVVNVPGTDRWYAAFHRHAIPDGNGYKRQVCLARMEFDADGAIKPMDPMVPAFKPGDAGDPVPPQETRNQKN